MRYKVGVMDFTSGRLRKGDDMLSGWLTAREVYRQFVYITDYLTDQESRRPVNGRRWNISVTRETTAGDPKESGPGQHGVRLLFQFVRQDMRDPEEFETIIPRCESGSVMGINLVPIPSGPQFRQARTLQNKLAKFCEEMVAEQDGAAPIKYRRRNYK